MKDDFHVAHVEKYYSSRLKPKYSNNGVHDLAHSFFVFF